MKLLYVNACVRPESRTKKLADYLISHIKAKEVMELNLDALALQPLNDERLNRRSRLIAEQAYSHKEFDAARAFATADVIVIAAPYWDMSFPATLKVFIENINVNKIVFKYSPEGQIIPQCQAQKLYYVTTKGGYLSDDFGFKYIEALCHNLYGIQNVTLITAEGLDIQGNNVSEILDKAKQQIDALF